MQQINITQHNNQCLYLSHHKENEISSKEKLITLRIRQILFGCLYLNQCHQYNTAYPECQCCIKWCNRRTIIFNLINLLCLHFYRLCKEFTIGFRIAAQKFHDNLHLFIFRCFIQLADCLFYLCITGLQQCLNLCKAFICSIYHI